MSRVKPRIYIDANVFITAFENVGARSDHAWWLLDAIEEGEIVGATSELTLAEVLVKPIERGAADLTAAYDKMIVPGTNFEVLPVGREVLISAARIRAERTSVKLPDAIHLASALALDCGFLVSVDQRMKVPEGLRLVNMSPFTVDEILGDRA